MSADRGAEWQRIWKCALANNTVNHGILVSLTGLDPQTVTELVNEHHKVWETHSLWTEGWGIPVVAEGTNMVGWIPGVVVPRRRRGTRG